MLGSKYLFAILLFTLHETSYGEIRRISSIYKDLGKVEKVYLHAGLITLIEFPDPIIEVRLGNNKAIRVEVSQVSPKEITIYLLSQNVSPTNLIVRSNQRVYIFDIVPSSATHQDYVRVLGGFSSPSFVGTIKAEPVRRPEPKKKALNVVKIGGE